MHRRRLGRHRKRCLRLCALSLSKLPVPLASSYHTTCLAARRRYFYQLNDDLMLVSEGWSSRFVNALRSSLLPGFGITGPLDLNNERLMTQSFSSCTHFDIFGFYYPWRFKNWYSDDWAAQLYAEFTFWQTDAEVDHSYTSGPRYVISYEHGKIVQPLLDAGRRRICVWLARQTLADGTNATTRFSPCAALRAADEREAEREVEREAEREAKREAKRDAERDAERDAMRRVSNTTAVAAAASTSPLRTRTRKHAQFRGREQLRHVRTPPVITNARAAALPPTPTSARAPHPTRTAPRAARGGGLRQKIGALRNALRFPRIDPPIGVNTPQHEVGEPESR